VGCDALWFGTHLLIPNYSVTSPKQFSYINISLGITGFQDFVSTSKKLLRAYRNRITDYIFNCKNLKRKLDWITLVFNCRLGLWPSKRHKIYRPSHIFHSDFFSSQ
jgi:hypothetical protein